MTRLLSFDVFDTCLVRTTAFPTDVFAEIAARLEPELQAHWGAGTVQNFIGTRGEAERLVRLESKQEEVTLAEIWAKLALMVPGIDATQGALLELECERRVLRPNPEIRERIQKARQAGLRIVFASDIYLPLDFIREELLRHGIAETSDGFYVSSELRKTKRTGNLFRYLLSAEAIPPAECLHEGDHPVSDVQMPRSLGMQATWLQGTQLSAREQALIRHQVLPAAAPESKLAAAMRLFRLRTASATSPAAHHLVADFLGPMLLTQAAWVLAAAKRDGVRRLHFLSRDSHLLWRAATELARSEGLIECRYLQVSRQALYLPAVEDVIPSEMPWLRRDFEQLPLSSIVSKLGMTWEELAPALKSVGYVVSPEHLMVSDADWEPLWRALAQEPVRSLVLERIQLRRRAATAYFTAQGLADAVPWAVVDLGWRLSCQASLKKVLNQAGFDVPVRGYYLGLQPDRVSPQESGPADALFYTVPPDQAGILGAAKTFSRIMMLEHVVSGAPHGTVHHYEPVAGGAVPVCGKVSPEMVKLSQELGEAVARFAAENVGLMEPLSDRTVAARIIDHLVDSFFSRPDRSSVEYLTPIHLSVDQMNAFTRPVAVPYTFTETLLAFLPLRVRRKLRVPERIRDWPEGSAAISSPLSRRLLALSHSVRAAWQTYRSLR